MTTGREADSFPSILLSAFHLSPLLHSPFSSQPATAFPAPASPPPPPLPSSTPPQQPVSALQVSQPPPSQPPSPPTPKPTNNAPSAARVTSPPPQENVWLARSTRRNVRSRRRRRGVSMGMRLRVRRGGVWLVRDRVGRGVSARGVIGGTRRREVVRREFFFISLALSLVRSLAFSLVLSLTSFWFPTDALPSAQPAPAQPPPPASPVLQAKLSFEESASTSIPQRENAIRLPFKRAGRMALGGFTIMRRRSAIVSLCSSLLSLFLSLFSSFVQRTS